MPNFETNPPALSIIIPVHNGGDAFRRCLESVQAAATVPLEVIAVIDGCPGGSEHVAREFDVRILKNRVRKGPAQARNLGAGHARGHILLFLDADITLPATGAVLVLRAFDRSPDLAAVFGSYDNSPLASNFLSQYKNLFHHYVHQNAHEKAFTFWSGCGAIRREIFEALEGFDESYTQPSIEDIELGYRLIQAGHSIRLLKQLQVKHLKRWRFFSLLKADFFFRALPWTRLILKRGRFNNDLNIKMADRIGVAGILLSILVLPAAGRLTWLPVVQASILLLLVVINRKLYTFFFTHRGLAFALEAILWHWFYYFYCGLAFLLGYIGFYLSRSGGTHFTQP